MDVINRIIGIHIEIPIEKSKKEDKKYSKKYEDMWASYWKDKSKNVRSDLKMEYEELVQLIIEHDLAGGLSWKCYMPSGSRMYATTFGQVNIKVVCADFTVIVTHPEHKTLDLVLEEQEQQFQSVRLVQYLIERYSGNPLVMQENLQKHINKLLGEPKIKE